MLTFEDHKLIYIILQLILITVFYFSGRKMSHTDNDKKYWKYAILPIFTFSIVSGLRFGRDIDYNVYYFIYSNPHLAEQQDLLFQVIVSCFKNLGIPYYLFVLACSTLLIFSFILLLKNFKNCAKYALPLFLMTEGIENLIRWYLAASFILIALHYLINNNYRRFVLYSILGCMTHLGIIILPLLLIVAYKFGNQLKVPPYIYLILFFVTSFFGNNMLLNSIATHILSLGFVDGRVLSYMNDITVDNGGIIFYKSSITTTLRFFIGYSFLIYAGSKYLFINTDRWLYHLSCIAIIISPIMNMMELFNRYSASLSILSTIAISIVWTKVFSKSETKVKIWVLGFGIVSLIFLVYPYFTDAFLKDKLHEVLFIWGANGRNYLNY